MKKRILGILFLALSVSFSGLNVYAENWTHVRWVEDGDTIVLQDGRRVRYIGINTPEIAQSETPAEPYADTAKRFNQKLVLNKRIQLVFDAEQFDRYSRTLAYIFLSDSTFVNAELIRAGYAFFVPRKPNVRHDQIFLKAQREAMTAGEGMWHNWSEKKEHYIGNRRSKRFHRMTCPYGKKTSLKNRLIFRSRWDAFWGGYSPGKKCK